MSNIVYRFDLVTGKGVTEIKSDIETVRDIEGRGACVPVASK